MAQFSAPSSLPANREFFMFRAIGRMLRSTKIGVDLDPAVVKEAQQLLVLIEADENCLGDR